MLERLGLGAVLDFTADKALVDMGRASAAAGTMRKGFERIGAGMATMSTGVQQFAGSLRTAVIGLGVPLVGAVVASAQFESSIAKIGTLLDGGTAEAEKYGTAIQDLAMKYGQASSSVSEGVYQAISASVPPDEVLEFMRMATEAAVAAGTDTAVSVDALSTVMNSYVGQLEQYGDAAGQASRISDMMFVAQKRGKTTFEEMSGAIGRVASTAAMAEVPFAELAAGIAAMTAGGIATEMSVVSLNQAILGFIKPTKQASDLAEQYGIDLSGAALRSKGLAGALADIQAKVGDNTDVLATLFTSVEAYRAVATLAGTASENFADILGEVESAVGITAEKFADVSNTLSFQFKRAMETGKVMATRIGDAFVEEFGLAGFGADFLQTKMAGVVDAARGFFRNVKEGFELLAPVWEGLKVNLRQIGDLFGSTFGGEWTDNAKKVAAALIVVGAALTPLAMVLGPVLGAFGGLFKIVMGAGSTLAGLWGVIKGGLALVVVPFGAALAAVAAVLAAVFITDAGGARTALLALWEPIKGIVERLGELARIVWDAVAPVFELIVGIVGGTLAGAFAVLGAALEGVIWVFDVAFGVVKDFWEAVKLLWDAIANALQPAFEKIAVVIDATWGVAFRGIGKGIKWVIEWIDALLKKLADFRDAMQETFIEGLSGLFGDQGIDKWKAQGGRVIIRETVTSGAYPGDEPEAVAPSTTAQQAQVKLAEHGAVKVAAGEAAQERAARSTPLSVNSKLHLDGREVAAAGGRAELELRERAGSDVSPWQRRMIVERGAVRVGG